MDGAHDKVRIGLLGAARIAPRVVVGPAAAGARIDVVAVAARDVQRAEQFAAQHSISCVHDSYDELLADPGIDAVYNPLPNTLHGRWTLAAIKAGKHVLCEKPFAVNESEARTVATAAADAGVVVLEGLHHRYHPLLLRAEEIVRSGELGRLRHVEANFCLSLPVFSDNRWRADLGGGSLLDSGCYVVHLARMFGGEPEVVSATAAMRDGVERAVTARLCFPEGHTGLVRSAMWSRNVLKMSARVTGDRGEMHVLNPIVPQAWHRLRVRTGAGERTERFHRRSSYAYQLDAFAAAVLDGGPVLTPPDDAVRTMAVLDAIRTAAGLPLPQPA
ncbi:putative dehydrogenase [Kibdelosporangium banguiense]|uniref:Dehydrogenase n=1 Tax=Kibdelosporangium banguiense TaxID=1365924 RepID=A0ABS4TXE6_9PSEU|nr:Gfo/Idh/MocA family oxidoreductase [Kibdelosporangium banguiense]MBP2328673.1 putative dehydrogenase [Kibdelosporangium banguiense]